MDNPFARGMVGFALAIRGEHERAEQAFETLYKTPTSGLLSLGPMGSLLRNQAALLAGAIETLKSFPNSKNLRALFGSTFKDLEKRLNNSPVKTNENTTDVITNTNPTHYLSTQEQAWILLASRALNAEQKENELIKVQVNDRELTSRDSNITLTLNQEMKEKLQITNQGQNNLWINATHSAIPKGEQKPESEGLKLESTYYDFEGNIIDTSTFLQGEERIVLIKGTFEDAEPHQLLLVDLLPAGVEIVNAKISEENKPFDWIPILTKTQFMEGRDDRFLAALDLDPSKNNFQIAYIIRAITPGVYIKPGLFAEDMYAVNFFARSETHTIEVLSP